MNKWIKIKPSFEHLEAYVEPLKDIIKSLRKLNKTVSFMGRHFMTKDGAIFRLEAEKLGVKKGRDKDGSRKG